MDYCNGVQSFINFATSIPKTFTGGGLGIHAGSVKLKSICIHMLQRCIFYTKGLWRIISVGMHTKKYLLVREEWEKNGCVNF